MHVSVQESFEPSPLGGRASEIGWPDEFAGRTQYLRSLSVTPSFSRSLPVRAPWFA